MAPQKHDALAFRLAEILRLLHSGERPTRSQLADRFAVNERTIYRDLNRLGDVIESASDGTYRLASHHRSSLSPADLRTFAKISGVQQLFPMGDRRSLLDILDSTNTSFLVRDAHFEASGPDSLLFKKLSQAVEHRQRCQLSYTSKIRLVEPYRLVHNKGIWYLAATESGRLKSFALGRIHELRTLDQAFEPDPNVYLQIEDDDDIWFGQDQIEVKVRVSARNAHYFLRRNVLPHQELLQQLDDGELLLRCVVNHHNQLLPIIRYWIPHIRILEPAWLQQKLCDELTDYLQ